METSTKKNNSMNPWYKSHKFWATIAGEIALITTVLSGEATVTQIVTPAVMLLLGYFGIRVAEYQVKK